MITIEKEKPAKEALELFTVTVLRKSDVGDSVQMGTKIQGHVAEIEAFLEATGVNPEEYKLILKHWEGELQRWSCHAKKGDKECPFCITYDEFIKKLKEEK